MRLEEAEISKHFANIFAAMSVSLTSELTIIAENRGINLKPVAKAMRHDNRIGQKAYILPGLGFTGGNLERDINIARQLIKDAGQQPVLLDAIVEANNRHNELIEKKVLSLLTSLQDKTITFWGATYKPHSDSLSGSLTIEYASRFATRGANVKIFDPVFENKMKPEIEGLAFCNTISESLFESECLIVMVPKPEFEILSPEAIGSTMKKRNVFDATNTMTSKKFIENGFEFWGLVPLFHFIKSKRIASYVYSTFERGDRYGFNWIIREIHLQSASGRWFQSDWLK